MIRLPGYPASSEGVPDGVHYVILEPISVHISGDERSRTHPGHGYLERTEYYWRYAVYKTREEWLAEVKERYEQGKTDFVPIEAFRPKIKTSTIVENKTNPFTESV